MQPLADKIRPSDLKGFLGQESLVGEGKMLSMAIQQDKIPSIIFWGPPGSGKTTLALIIAKQTKSEFKQLSAVSSGKKDLQAVIEEAQMNVRLGKKTILFVDEIHRWNKAQQDALLPFVERGVVTFIGSTTENPSFEVISALLSRTRVFVLKKLSEEELLEIEIQGKPLTRFFKAILAPFLWKTGIPIPKRVLKTTVATELNIDSEKGDIFTVDGECVVGNDNKLTVKRSREHLRLLALKS